MSSEEDQSGTSGGGVGSGSSGNVQEIFVSFEGQRYCVNADVDDTFLEIKQALETQTGVPVGEQHLSVHKSTIQIRDDKSLKFYRYNGGGFFNLSRKTGKE